MPGNFAVAPTQGPGSYVGPERLKLAVWFPLPFGTASEDVQGFGSVRRELAAAEPQHQADQHPQA